MFVSRGGFFDQHLKDCMLNNRTISSCKRMQAGEAASVLWALWKFAAGSVLELMETAHC